MLSDGLRLGHVATSPRSGLLFLEPLRRLALLAAAAAAAAAAAGAGDGDERAAGVGSAAGLAPPPVLLGYLALLRETDTAAAEFTPMAEGASSPLHQIEIEVSCCQHGALCSPPQLGEDTSVPISPPISAPELPLLALISEQLAPLSRPGTPPARRAYTRKMIL